MVAAGADAVKFAGLLGKVLLPAVLDRGIYDRIARIRDEDAYRMRQRLAHEEGLLVGPRLFICGRALSQTGGHADMTLAELEARGRQGERSAAGGCSPPTARTSRTRRSSTYPTGSGCS